MRVTTGFEGGRVHVLGADERRLYLAVPHDHAAPRFRQWFAFDVEAPAGTKAEVVLENAHECTWGHAFGGAYRVFASDGDAWHRAETRLEHGKLVVSHRLANTRARLAYYPPYPASRIAGLRRLAKRAGGSAAPLATTLQGRPIDRLSLGRGGRRVWVLAQQHPGESMAGWFVEGLVTALAEGGPRAASLLERATVHIVPRMNPDGAAMGNHRTTPLGVDLNRAWSEAAPPVEVGSVRDAMSKAGADLVLDIHGDEQLPYVFAQPADRYPNRPERIGKAINAFEQSLAQATPDFQTEHKYPYHPSHAPNTMLLANWAQGHFGCAALTIEMPFSDHKNRPDPRGFFPARARRLGEKSIIAMLAALDAFGG